MLKIENTQRFSLEEVRKIVSTFDFLETKRISIKQKMYDFQHSTQKSIQVQCNRVDSVGKTSTELENLLEINKNKNLGLEQYFSLEPYVEICKKAKEWIQEKVKELNLTRDRGISR